MKRLNLLHTDDYALSRIQGNVDRFSRQFKNIPILDGKLIEDLALTTSDTSLTHGLGRPLRGWVIVRSNANAVVYESSTSNPAPESSILLKASATATVSLWVF